MERKREKKGCIVRGGEKKKGGKEEGEEGCKARGGEKKKGGKEEGEERLQGAL